MCYMYVENEFLTILKGRDCKSVICVKSRLVHYHNALRRMLGSSEVRGKASLDAGKNEKVNTSFALRTGVIIIELMGHHDIFSISQNLQTTWLIS